MSHLILQVPREPSQFPSSHLTDEQTETQRGRETCLRPQRKLGRTRALALNPRRSSSQVPLSPAPLSFALLDAEKGSLWPSGLSCHMLPLGKAGPHAAVCATGAELLGFPQQQQLGRDSREGEEPGRRWGGRPESEFLNSQLLLPGPKALLSQGPPGWRGKPQRPYQAGSQGRKLV